MNKLFILSAYCFILPLVAADSERAAQEHIAALFHGERATQELPLIAGYSEEEAMRERLSERNTQERSRVPFNHEVTVITQESSPVPFESGAAVQTRALVPYTGVEAPLQALPGSFFARQPNLYAQYKELTKTLASAGSHSMAGELRKTFGPLLTADAHSGAAVGERVAAFGESISGSSAAGRFQDDILSFVKRVQLALRPSKGVIATVACAAVAAAGYVVLNAWFKQHSKEYLKWRTGGGWFSGWSRDESGNIMPAYALGVRGVNESRARSLAEAGQKRVVLRRIIEQKGAGPKRIVVKEIVKKKAIEYISSNRFRRKFRDFVVGRDEKLRPHVVKPNQNGNVFERAAFAISQVPYLSVEDFRREQEAAEPHVRERMEKLFVAEYLGAGGDFPGDLVYKTGIEYGAISAALHGYGSVVELKKRDDGDTRLDVDGTFVYRFYPFTPREGGTYKYVPGEGYKRISNLNKYVEGVGFVREEGVSYEEGGYEPQGEESVIIKVANPYAARKIHDCQRLMGAGGENQGLDRQVRRVLVAGEIRRRAMEGTEVRSDVMVEGWLEEQEREQEAAAWLAAAQEPFVLEPDDYQQGDVEEGKNGAGEEDDVDADAAVAAIVADDAEVEIPSAAPLQVLPRITAPRKYLALRPGAEGRLIDDRTAVVMTECLEPDSSLEFDDFTDAEIDRLIQICDDFDLTDIHPWNIMVSKGRFYMIDLEKISAYPKRLRDDFRYMAFRMPGVFSDALAKRIRDRLRALGRHVTEFDGTK